MDADSGVIWGGGGGEAVGEWVGGQEDAMLLTRTRRDRDRDGRERWVGRSGFTSVHVRRQCSAAE